jgi:hypothetical protein
MTTFRDFLVEEFPGARISELSGSNNLVYQVRTEHGPLVAKHVTDGDIPLGYLAEATAALGEHLPVQRIHRVCRTEAGDPFDAVFAEYVEGENLAAAMGREDGGVSTEALVDHLCAFVRACRHLPPMREGYGLYKKEAPSLATWPEFVVHYGRRYWNRVRPFYQGTSTADAVDRWLDGGFAETAAAHPAAHTVVSIDANLKNTVVTPEGSVVVLNVPIAALSTPAHAVGAISLHLRHRQPYKPFLDAAAEQLCPDDAALIPHFELWGMLGILSFYAVREPDRQREWRNWGSPVLLDDDFRDLVRAHLPGADAR